MNREEFGQLIATLRKEIINPVTSKPRTQPELAQLANLPVRAIGQIEQGQKMNLDPHTLNSLSGALRLTSLERIAFLNAAAEVDIEPHPDIKPPSEILTELLRTTQSICVPAMIYDSYYNIIAGNSLMFAISGASETLIKTGEDSPAGYNLLRYVFADESSYRQIAGPDWKRFGRRMVQHFRSTSLKYRYTHRFQEIFSDLCQYLAFQEAWAGSIYSSNDIYNRTEEHDFVHPQYGPLNYLAIESITTTGAEDLFLVTHVPRTLETVRAFEELSREVGFNMHRFTEWPYPPAG